MSRDLYHQRMLELAERGDASERLADAEVSVTLDNPLCGDRVRIDLDCAGDGRIDALSHEVRGCVLCRAAAAVLDTHAPGLDADELRAVRDGLRDGLRGERTLPAAHDWPEFAVFEPVAAHKSRHECVLLPFDAVLSALDQRAASANGGGRTTASTTGT